MSRNTMISSLLIWSWAGGSALASTWYVDQDAPGPHDGTTWENAFADLQDALAIAAAGDMIRVAQGRYTPDGDGDRTATFQLVSGVQLFGAYAGFGEPDPDARDIQTYETLLSGDLLGDDGPDFANTDENSIHVVIANGTDASTKLDGFTISGGNAEGTPDLTDFGGGIYCLISDIVASNCLIKGNRSLYDGAGIYSDDGSPTIEDCIFEANNARSGAGLRARDGSPRVRRCIFTRNEASSGSGAYVGPSANGAEFEDCVFVENISGIAAGAYVFQSDITLRRCHFLDNAREGLFLWLSDSVVDSCMFRGDDAFASGDLLIQRCDPVITNCLFTDIDSILSSSILATLSANPLIVNCTIIGNFGGIISEKDSVVAVFNSLLWANARFDEPPTEGSQLNVDEGGSFVVHYSNVQGWTGTFGGQGNSGDYPLFVDPARGDYRLQEQSPAIDSGSNFAVPLGTVADLDGNPRFVDAGCVVDSGEPDFVHFPVDRGAYENFGDCNGNGVIDVCEVDCGPKGGVCDIPGCGQAPMNCNANGCPDECEEDCNLNAAPDDCDIESGFSEDVNGNGIPDECEPTVIYVDADAPGPHNGVEWSLAYSGLAEALNAAAESVGFIEEIRSAEGIYVPAPVHFGLDPRSATFSLVDGVRIFGGYAGIGAQDPDERDVSSFETILSGDLMNNDGPGFLNNQDNSLHVVTAAQLPSGVELNGLTITAGNADYLDESETAGIDPRRAGGGIYNIESDLTLRNCVLRSNTSRDEGAGMLSFDASLTFEACLVEGNVAGDNGGGIYIDGGSAVFDLCVFDANQGERGGAVLAFTETGTFSFQRCTFTNNRSVTLSGWGAGIAGGAASLLVSDCDFVGNSAEEAAGAAVLGGQNASVIFSRFRCNTSLGTGGALIACADSNHIENCLFEDNHAEPFGNGGGLVADGDETHVQDCLFVGNRAAFSGGGLHDGPLTDTTIVDCSFRDNTAGLGGGGVDLNAQATMNDCLVHDNQAQLGGGVLGAFAPFATNDIHINHCTIADNTAVSGGGYYNAGFSTVSDCIIWANEPDDLEFEQGALTVEYSNFSDEWPGEGNISTDPLWTAGPLGCYYLGQIAAGQPEQSPCVDAGSDTATAFGLDTLTTRRDEVGDGGVVDMGFHAQISGVTFVQGDADADGDLDLRDYAGLQHCVPAACNHTCRGSCCFFDFEPDGDVDLVDFAAFVDALTGP